LQKEREWPVLLCDDFVKVIYTAKVYLSLPSKGNWVLHTIAGKKTLTSATCYAQNALWRKGQCTAKIKRAVSEASQKNARQNTLPFLWTVKAKNYYPSLLRALFSKMFMNAPIMETMFNTLVKRKPLLLSYLRRGRRALP
jgi:hypothetical protein